MPATWGEMTCAVRTQDRSPGVRARPLCTYDSPQGNKPAPLLQPIQHGCCPGEDWR